MLIPQFSIRGLMVGTAIFGALSWVVVRGLRGHPLAGAVTGMLALLLVLTLVAAVTFFLAWLFHLLQGVVLKSRERRRQP